MTIRRKVIFVLAGLGAIVTLGWPHVVGAQRLPLADGAGKVSIAAALENDAIR